MFDPKKKKNKTAWTPLKKKKGDKDQRTNKKYYMGLINCPKNPQTDEKGRSLPRFCV